MVQRNSADDKPRPDGAAFVRTPEAREPFIQGLLDVVDPNPVVLGEFRVPDGINTVVQYFGLLIAASEAPANQFSDVRASVGRDPAGALVSASGGGTGGALLNNFDLVISGPDTVQFVADNIAAVDVEYGIQLVRAADEMLTAVVA
jgi:hypothetical protein